jgi:Tfp pilus assembly protein PilN
MNQMDLRRLFAVGTGVGIEIGAEDLNVVMVRVRPSGVAVLGRKTIAGFRERPAAEWGSEYSQFLKSVGGSHLAATALLPRGDVVVRPIAMPGISDRDLASAISFQVDSLHPYAEEEARYGWARLPKTPVILTGIARGGAIERYSELFAEAGVKLASLTFSAAALYSALRLLSVPPAGGFLGTASANGCTELYGESPARPVLSAVVDSGDERALSLAAAELRLPEESQPASLSELLPVPLQTPEGYDPSRDAMPYATALAGACPRLALQVNLLPAERRATSSRAIYVPTAALAVALAGLLIAMVAQGKIQERRHLEQLQAEIARLEPLAGKVNEAEQAAVRAQARIRMLDSFRRRTPADLEVLAELTKMLAAPAWLSALDVTREGVNLSGETEQAALLLRTLDNSKLFQNSEFTLPIARSGGLEIFRIRAQREGAPK